MALERISKVGSSGISTTVSFRSTGITVTGIVTATSFVGDGSGLTGVVGSGSGVVIKDDNATVGTASTINFGSNLSVSAISAGIVTVTATDTNTTYTQSAVSDSSNVRLRLSGSDSTTDDILLTAGSNITFSSVTDNGFTISAAGGGGGGSIVGIDTTGTSFFNNLNISGVTTSSSFVGSGSRLTGIVTTISAGSGISINQATGTVTITATGGGGGSIVGIDTTGTSFFNRLNISGVATANSFVKSGGTSSQFLKADGTVDSSTYLTSYTETDTLNTVTGRGNSTLNGISVGILTSTTLNVGTGGTVITTTSNGLVGIGTATPTSALTVKGNTSLETLNVSGVSTFSYIQNTGITSTKDLIVYGTGNESGSISTMALMSRTNYLDFGPAITNTTAPQSFALRIGSDRATGTFGPNKVFEAVYYGSNSGAVFINDWRGNEAIIVGDNEIAAGRYVPVFVGGISSTGTSGQKLQVTGGAYISGNTGIGTTNPTQTLDVGGTTRTQQLNVTGVSTFAGITTVTGVTLFAKQINVSGVVTATSFSGDGSGLTGIVAQGSGISVKDDGTLVGIAGTLDFGSNLTVTPVSAGIVTITGPTTYWTTNSLGIHTTTRVAIGTTGFNESFAHEDGTLLVQESGIIARVRVRNNNTSSSSFSSFNLKSPNAEWSIYTNGATNYLRIYDVLNNAARMHIDSSGNVGINSTSPTAKLDVTGDAKISSGLQVTGITTLASYAGPVSTWTVTGNGSSFFFSGPGFDGTETNPTLYLVRGQKYRFNGTAGHPIRIQSTPTGTSYDAGVTNNSTATVDFNVQDDAPDVLFYQCTIHSGMRGRIFITGKRIVEGSWTAVAGTLTNIDTITGISTNKFRTAEYTLHFENSASGIQAQKVLVMQDINNATAYSQEYGVMYQPNLLVSVGSSISGGSFFLNATPETGISGVTTYRYTRELIQ